MQQNNNEINNIAEDEISLKELILKIKDWYRFLLTKWLVIVAAGIIGGAIGIGYAFLTKPEYTGNLSFALEDEKQGAGGLSGALGLASSLGIDLGTSAGGAFSGANLIELLKSRNIVEKALLNPITVNGKTQSFAQYYINFNELNKDWDEKPLLKGIEFAPDADRSKFTLQQDSILGKIYESIAGANGAIGLLSVAQKDKKISIINIEVKSTDELFSKAFTESIAQEVSSYYIEIKSKKARQNMEILQHQTDSIRAELNGAITGVAAAADNTFGLNPAMMVRKTPGTRRQVDVQANTAILTQLVTNLEMAKVSLRKETPLIQVIDRPILPLKKEKVGKLKSLILGGFLAGFLTVLVLIFKKLFAGILAD
jgi:uncharacterized protein involved in exopolysaccharide biosynthesis